MEVSPHTAPFSGKPEPEGDLAADVIRQKIQALYDKAAQAKMPKQIGRPPSVNGRAAGSPSGQPTRSAHAEFRDQLSKSGKSMAEIQTAWHNYYVNLPDHQKHQVWQEFYSASAKNHGSGAKQAGGSKSGSRTTKKRASQKSATGRTVGQIKEQILKQVDAQGKLQAKHHLQSILFGLGLGAIVTLIMLFGFFNERIIAPFITPSRTVSNTPIIADTSTTASTNPEVIIPKINVEIPVVYGMDTINEAAVENALEGGVVHYATTPSPGEHGNAVFFGHSSNNILNKGKYKFAFVLLHEMQIGDTFMLTKDGKRYTYQIYKRQVVNPNQVSVLGPADKPDSATLITCDPPGTSLKRLVVTGQQISPDPSGNTASTAIATSSQLSTIPSNSPTLWSRLTSWLFH